MWNNLGSWSAKSRVWNAGKGVLQSFGSGGLSSLLYLLISGISITFFLYSASVAQAARETVPFTGLPKPSFDISKVIEKAEHTPLLKDNQYTVEDKTYRAIFAPEGVTYLPILQGESSLPLFFYVSQIGLSSGQVLWTRGMTSASLRKENALLYQRTPEITEVYETLRQGVEQSWILKKDIGFSADSDLRIIIEVETSLSGTVTSQGEIEFVDQKGVPHARYSKATIIDADGKALEAAPSWDAADSRIVLNISGEWLAAAAYPVIVDPLLNTVDIAVDTASGTNESYPAVAFDGVNYLIVYQSGTANGTGTGTSDIKGVRVSAADGAIVDATPLSIATTANVDEGHPSVAYDPANGRYLVVWERWNSATASDIVLNTINPSTGAVGSAVTVSASTTRIQAYASIACCDTTNAYVTWARPGTDGGTRLTQLGGAQINKGTLAVTSSDPTGTLTNTSGPTSDPTAAPSVSPKIIFTNTTLNQYLLVWEDYTDSYGDLKAQIYTVGSGWGTEWTVASTGALPERYPVPAFDGTNYLVAYQQGATGGSADIYGQFATTTGANQGAAFAISATSGQDEVTPALAWVSGTCSATPVNRYLAVWGQGATIQAMPVTAAGALESVITLSQDAASTKLNPAIVQDEGSCRYFVAWSDDRSGSATPYDIYAQRVGYPNISNLSPTSGYEGQAISINGINFGADPGAGNRSTAINNVTLNGSQISDSNITSWSDTLINFTIPTGTAAGTYPVGVKAGSWNSNNSNLTVTNPPLQITTTSLPAGYQWLSYGSNVSATGGQTPYNWSIISGSLPAGLTLNSSTGLISGTPGEFGTFNITVRVTDSTTPTPQTADKALSIVIYELTTITVTPANPTITPGQTVQFTATGTYSDTSTSNITGIVTWSSSNALVATVDASGLATGVGLGSVTISATK